MANPKVDAWFNQFQQRIGRRDLGDNSATIDLTRPEDRRRIVAVPELSENPAEMVDFPIPETGEITDEVKEKLYELAETGRLFALPLGSDNHNIFQANVQEDSTLEPLKTNPYTGALIVEEVAPPEVKGLGFFESLLNRLFGLFAEKKRLYEEAWNEYDLKCDRIDCAQELIGITKHSSGNFSRWRLQEIKRNNENFREMGPGYLESTVETLNRTDLPQWERRSLEVKKELLEGIINGGAKPYTDAEIKDLLIDLTIGAILKKPKNEALKNEVENDPQKMQILRDVLGMSTSIKTTMDQNKKEHNALLISCALMDNSVDSIVDAYYTEVRDRKDTADMLVSEGKMNALSAGISGMKEAFESEQITQRMEQLRSARRRLTAEDLQYESNGKIYTDSIMDVRLSDKRILAIYNKDQMNIDQNQFVRKTQEPRQSLG